MVELLLWCECLHSLLHNYSQVQILELVAVKIVTIGSMTKYASPYGWTVVAM